MAAALPDSIKTIQLTPEGKHSQTKMVLINDPDISKFILKNPQRIEILKTLRKGIEDLITTTTYNDKTRERIIRQQVITRNVLSVVEIVKLSHSKEAKVELSRNQVYFHLSKMIEAGLIIKYGTIKKGNRTTDFYRRTAKGFYLLPNSATKEKMHTHMKRNLKSFNLPKLGTEETLRLIAQIEQKRWKDMEEIRKWISNDVIDDKTIELLEFFVWIYAWKNPEVTSLIEKLHKRLFS